MRKNKKSFFTLLEVLVSMGVFSLLMLALMQFFSAAQGVWERTGNKAEIFESAKTTMDIIANDLACAYFDADSAGVTATETSGDDEIDVPQYQFFFYDKDVSSSIMFAAQTENGNAAICYKWVAADWKLYRMVINESDYFTAGAVNPLKNWPFEKTSYWFTRAKGGSNKVFCISSDGIGSVSTENNELAENVLDFTFSAYKKENLKEPINVSASDVKFPDVVMVSMTVLSNDAHEKLRNRFADKTTDAAKDAEIQTLFNTTTFQYIKSDGSDSSESEKKTVKQMLIDGTPPAGGDDTTQAILFNGCQRFTRAVSLVDRVNSL